jgi:hypothetical protein
MRRRLAARKYLFGADRGAVTRASQRGSAIFAYFLGKHQALMHFPMGTFKYQCRISRYFDMVSNAFHNFFRSNMDCRHFFTGHLPLVFFYMLTEITPLNGSATFHLPCHRIVAGNRKGAESRASQRESQSASTSFVNINH